MIKLQFIHTKTKMEPEQGPWKKETQSTKQIVGFHVIKKRL